MITNEFYWEKPLHTHKLATEKTYSRSKEEIISDMDAEIKRLQRELEIAREDS